MSYFTPGHTGEHVRAALLAVADLNAGRALDAAGDKMRGAGVDPDDYIALASPAATAKAQQRKRDLEERLAAAANQSVLALIEIRERAVDDARVAWQAGETYFAPVLFQPLKRDDARWEVALGDIAAVGWTLDSWQVIGPAPEPFDARVTLIQTLFTR